MKVLNLIIKKNVCTSIIVSPMLLCHSHESLVHSHLITIEEKVKIINLETHLILQFADLCDCERWTFFCLLLTFAILIFFFIIKIVYECGNDCVCSIVPKTN